MAEVIDIRREPADFPCGSWWANATLALPVIVFFAECCPLRCGTSADSSADVAHQGARATPAPPDVFLIELVETWSTSRIVRVGADGACEIVYEGAKRRGPWRAMAYCDDEPAAVSTERSDRTGDGEFQELVANTPSPPGPAPLRAEPVPLP